MGPVCRGMLSCQTSACVLPGQEGESSRQGALTFCDILLRPWCKARSCGLALPLSAAAPAHVLRPQAAHNTQAR